MSYVSLQRTANSVEGFNHSLDYEIYKIRKDEDSPRNINIGWHSMVGKRIRNTETNKEYTVLSVNKQFHGGWYLGLLMIDDKDSSTFKYFNNVSSIADTVIDSINEFWEKHEVVEERNDHEK
jgi:hypothetical protein